MPNKQGGRTRALTTATVLQRRIDDNGSVKWLVGGGKCDMVEHTIAASGDGAQEDEPRKTKDGIGRLR